jgi:protein-tyrosine-phosphatase
MSLVGTGNRRRVLFVCVGNTCRSPMAAALAQEFLGMGAQVESAGTAANDGSQATADAVDVMKERGLNLESHRSRPVRSVDLGRYDVVVALTPSIAEYLRRQGSARSNIEVMNVPDPLSRGLGAYRETADAIELEIRRIFGGGDVA